MTSLKLPTVVVLMAMSAGIGASGVVYLRPLQPPPQQTAMAPPAPPVQIKPPPAVRTVTWFTEHQDEMRAKAALCNDNPGVGQHDPECTNALAAKSDVGFDALINSK